MVDRAAIGRRSARIGSAAESACVKVMHANGFDKAERRRVRRHDALDIIVCPGVIASVKAGAYARTASLGAVSGWHAEAEAKRREHGADFALLVVQRAGYGNDRAAHWRCWVIGEHGAAVRNELSISDPVWSWGFGDIFDHADFQLARALELLRLYGYGSAQ